MALVLVAPALARLRRLALVALSGIFGALTCRADALRGFLPRVGSAFPGLVGGSRMALVRVRTSGSRLDVGFILLLGAVAAALCLAEAEVLLHHHLANVRKVVACHFRIVLLRRYPVEVV